MGFVYGSDSFDIGTEDYIVKVRTFIHSWTTNNTNTTIDVTCDMGLQFIHTFTKRVGFPEGYMTGGYGTATYEYGETTFKDKKSGDYYFFPRKTKTITKTTSAQTFTVSLNWYNGAGNNYKATANISIPALASYNVTFNANGGSGAPGTQKKYYGKNLTLSSTKPTRTGYTFVRWNTNTSNTGTAYNPGATYTGNAALTLYAIWKANTWTVTFNANGGSGAPAAQTKTYGVNLTLSSTKPTRTGYNFVRWNTNTSNTGTAYSPGGTYSANAAVTLYAIWQLQTWTVSYNANGGSGAPANQTKTYGQNLTLSATKPTRTGYDFKRWNTNTSDTGTAYNPSATYTGNAALALYAIWIPHTYPVTYDANGGTGAPNVQTKTQDVTLTLSSTIPTRDGHDFKGWNTASDGSGTTYAAGSNYTGNTALKLYAMWQIWTYTISYDANTGTGAPPAQIKTWGTPLTLTDITPVKNDYRFVKWNTRADGSGVSYDPNDIYTAEADLQLYAIWISTYTPPTISNLIATRVSRPDGGTAYLDNEYGTTARVVFKWVAGQDAIGTVIPDSIKIGYRVHDVGEYVYTTISDTSELENTVTVYVGQDVIDVDNQYDIQVILIPPGEGRANIVRTTYVSKVSFIMDVNANGTAVAVGVEAPDNMSGFIMGFDPYITLDIYAEADTVDGKLYAAIHALGWDEGDDNVLIED